MVALIHGLMISIHALRGEGDGNSGGYIRLNPSISIHALRGEGDLNIDTFNNYTQISIHALRGEGDAVFFYPALIANNFNPRPPWGGRQMDCNKTISFLAISIHALRGEGDPTQTPYMPAILSISIHALRGEGDAITPERLSKRRYFNPRPPWGGRRLRTRRVRPYGKFQSTPSVGRATNGKI